MNFRFVLIISSILHIFLLTQADEFAIGAVNIAIIKQDITKLSVDVIVNAANKWLPPSPSGVAGAIWRAAGVDQLNNYIQCNNCAPIEVGSVAITPSFGLEVLQSVKYIIHAVGPNIKSGESIQLLYDAYKNSLIEAEKLQLRSIAFPPISTGIFGGDLEQCAQQAAQAVYDFVSSKSTSLKEIYFVYFDDSYANLLKKSFMIVSKK